jgi:hypothetical protein
MNEHIKKLVDQAFDESQHPGGFGLNFEKFQEKFAELIVRECIDIALKSGSVPNKSEVAVVEADRIYHKIQEHFGVEE